MLAQKTRYALRSLLYLAEEAERAPIQLGSIATTQHVPPKYLELIMLDLKKAGMVRSTRGPKGGYELARPAAEISFGEVVRAMEGPIALISCASVNFYAPCGDCHDEETCDMGGLGGWLESSLAIDVIRATRLETSGYRVWTQTIPADITPKNRLLLGVPVGPAAGPPFTA